MARDKDSPEVGEAKANPKEAGGSLKLIIRLMLLLSIVVVCSGAGYGVGTFLRSEGGPVPPVAATSNEDVFDNEPTEEGERMKYYESEDFQGIVQALNVPRLDKYVRIGLSFEIKSSDCDEAQKLIESKKPILLDSLRAYLSGLTLDDVRGQTSYNRMRREILESFNKQLWPSRRPLIQEIRFKQFQIQ